MKSLKGKLLKKLKTIKTIGYLKPEIILQVNASDSYFQPPLHLKSSQFQPQTQKDPILMINLSSKEQKPEIIDVTELMRDLENEEIESNSEKENIRPEKVDKESVLDPKKGFLKDMEMEFEGDGIDPSIMRSIRYMGDRELEDYDMESDFELNEKENIRPEKRDENREFPVLDPKKGNLKDPLSELDVSEFRRPDLDSGSLFDPNLLAAFEQAVIEFKAQEAERLATMKEKEKDLESNEPPLKARKLDENTAPLLGFEDKCPPGGSNSVILYTTSLRTIRKTFEECHTVRFLLENFRVLYFERDISMHFEYREELWRLMGEKLVPPCLFIRGRYIGGAQRVLALHEQGKLRPLFEGVPIDRLGLCIGCGGARFVVCFKCNGSNKAVECDDVATLVGSCPECNENGLIVCPLCC